MKILVSIRDQVGSNFLVNEIKRIEQISELDCERLARECESIIRQTITNKIKRAGSTGNLAMGFYAHPFSTSSMKGWAVGDISELDDKIKYWNHVDKGSEAIGANWQHYLPLGNWVDERWVKDSDDFTFIPSKPIPAANYISETISQMENLIPQILGR